MDKLMVAVATIAETGEQVVIYDQNNEPVIITLAEALKLKFEGFPFNFADIRDVFDIIEITIN
jgi:hypothetical protein